MLLESKSIGKALASAVPTSGNLGSVRSSTLEQSDVDLAAQFVRMIINQRAFQANTRTVSVTNELMGNLVSLGVIVDTFETAIGWDRFDAFHADVVKTVRDVMKRECGKGRVQCRFTHVYPDGSVEFSSNVKGAQTPRTLETGQVNVTTQRTSAGWTARVEFDATLFGGKLPKSLKLNIGGYRTGKQADWFAWMNKGRENFRPKNQGILKLE